jgi:hypothetical protein
MITFLFLKLQSYADCEIEDTILLDPCLTWKILLESWDYTERLIVESE